MKSVLSIIIIGTLGFFIGKEYRLVRISTIESVEITTSTAKEPTVPDKTFKTNTPVTKLDKLKEHQGVVHKIEDDFDDWCTIPPLEEQLIKGMSRNITCDRNLAK